MSTEFDETGPIDYLVVEFPGNKMTGEGLPLLVDLVDAGIIRILDLVFVRRELDGSIKAVEIADFDDDGQLDLAVFEGAASGLLGPDDVDEATSVIEPGTPPESWSTKTCGPHPSPGPCAAAGRSWWPAAASRSRRSSAPRTGADVEAAAAESEPSRPSPNPSKGLVPCLVFFAGSPAPPSSPEPPRAVHGRVSPRRQEGRWAQPRNKRPPPSSPRPATPSRHPPTPSRRRLSLPGGMDDKLTQLKQLGELRDAGVLSDAEFEAQKGKILYA